jgi:hypothetical protein
MGVKAAACDEAARGYRFRKPPIGDEVKCRAQQQRRAGGHCNDKKQRRNSTRLSLLRAIMFAVEMAVEQGYQAPDPCDGMADPPE